MTEQVGWVTTSAGEVYAGLHLPAAGARAAGVLLVPPFGWEGVSAGRNLRAWARELSAAGHPALRFQLPGSGDSAGLGGEQDVTSWTAAVADLVAELRRASGCTTVTVVGLGLGGLLALRAVAEGAPVDDLVLWATPVKGRLLLRELRAFAALAAEPGDTSPAAPQPLEEVTTGDGVLWVHGYPLGVAAQEQLASLDAAALDLSAVRRAMVLGRGSLPPDRKLAAALSAAGADVTSGPGPGFDELTVEPRLSEVPDEVIRTVAGWLRPEPASAEPAAPGLLTAPFEEELAVLGTAAAVLHRVPDAPLTAVFLSAGAINRSGPNRLWTEAARRWADWGIASARLDLHSIGEAGGPDAYPFGPEGFYDEEYRPQLRDVLDALVREGLPDRFLLVGLCSGGYWAAQLAMHEPRTAGVVVLNAVSLVWPPPLLSSRNRHYLVSKETWKRFLHDPRLRREAALQVRHAAAVATARLRPGAPVLRSSVDVLAVLEEEGTPVTVAASPGEAILEDLDHLPPGSAARVRRLEGPVGAHTLSPTGLRAQAEALMDEAARLALDGVRSGAPASR